MNSKSLFFDKKFLSDCTFSNLRCPKCKAEYSVFAVNNGVGVQRSNRPYLLKCGHNLCERCFLQDRKHLCCTICLKPIDMRNCPKTEIRNICQWDFYLIGKLYYYKNFRGDSTEFNASQLQRKDRRTDLCGECDFRPSTGFCKSCKSAYCQTCFDKVHLPSKILQSHILTYTKGNPNHQIDPLREIKDLEKQICHYHKLTLSIYCTKCRLECCKICLKKDHYSHIAITISDENFRYKNEIDVALESIHGAREKLKKTQRTVKNSEKQFQTYATEVCEEICNFFENLHQALQNEENQILEDLKACCLEPSKLLYNAQMSIKDVDDNLKKMRSILETFRQEIPKNFLIKEILEKYQNLIENPSLNTQILKFDTNPFKTKLNGDSFFEVMSRCIEWSYTPTNDVIVIKNDGKLQNQSMVQQRSFKYLKESRSNKENLSIFQANKRKQLGCNFQKCLTATLDESFLSSLPYDITADITNLQILDESQLNPSRISTKDETNFIDKNDKFRVVSMKDPLDFYIQNDELIKTLQPLIDKYSDLIDSFVLKPKKIIIGQIYMIYVENDKAWYRGKALKNFPKDHFGFYLIDTGKAAKVHKDNILNLAFGLGDISCAAFHCSVYEITCKIPSNWSKDELFALRKITETHLFYVKVFQKNNGIFEIDLINCESELSVRSAMLYMGLVVDSTITKLELPMAKKANRIVREKLSCDVLKEVKVLHVEDPLEFYVVQTEDFLMRKNIWDRLCYEFDIESKIKRNPIYLGSIHMACICYLNEQPHRASIEDIKSYGKVLVYLVDEGVTKVVHWSQLYELPPSYREVKAFSLKCSLADIEPLQKNDYVWTKDALNEFGNMVLNPKLFIKVISVTNDEHSVSLFSKKGVYQINLGASLVEKNLALSTGPASKPSEIFQSETVNVETSDKKDPALNYKSYLFDYKDRKDENPMNDLLKKIKRTPVQLVQVESPGEFYVMRSRDLNGLRLFHEKIQMEMKSSDSDMDSPDEENIKWSKEDECFVYTDLKNCKKYGFNFCNDQISQWYRGIIKGFTSDKKLFTLFLIDVGLSIDKIPADRLRPMPMHYKNVAKAAYLCHLACLSPTNGETAWPQKACDFFIEMLKDYKNFEVTMQAKPDEITKSIAVILWGTQIKTSDALAPNVTNYVNFIRLFVVNGMGHMLEPLDFNSEMGKILRLDFQDKEITLDSFQGKLLHPDNDEGFFGISDTENLEKDDETFELLKQLNDLNMEITTPQTLLPEAWSERRPIKKTIFSGYPTYIDYQGNIYIYEYYVGKVIEKMCSIIEKTYKPAKDFDLDRKYGLHQPCLVKYHINDKYYRGVVQKILSSNQYEILFIDFGNVDECSALELLPYAPFRNVQALCSIYCFGNIKPLKDESDFSIPTLDVMHKMIVGQLVHIRVVDRFDDEIKPCQIKLNGNDVAEDLVARGYVAWKSPEDEEQAAQKKFTDQKKFHKKMKKPHQTISNDWSLKIVKEKRVKHSNIEDDVDPSQPENDTITSTQVDVALNKIIYGHSKVENSSQFNKAADSINDNDPHSKVSAKPLFSFEDYKQFFVTKNQMKPLEKDDDDSTEMQSESVAKPFGDLEKPKHLDDKVKCCGNMCIDEINDPNSDDKDPNFYQEEEDHSDMENFYPEDLNVVDKNLDYENADGNFISVTDMFSANIDAMEIDDNEEAGDLLRENPDETITTEKAPLIRAQLSNNRVVTSFIPNDSSTAISSFSHLKYLKPLRLPLGLKKFECEIAYMGSPISFYILPFIVDFYARSVELQNKIRYIKRIAKPLDEIKVGIFCLAHFSGDQKWHRAVIRSVNPIAETVDVLYIDYLSIETLKYDQLREIPFHLIKKWPARIMKVHFPNVEMNPKMKQKEIFKVLYKTLKKQSNFYAQLKEDDENNEAEEKRLQNTSFFPFDGHDYSLNVPDLSSSDSPEDFHTTNKSLKFSCHSTPIDLFLDKDLKESVTESLIRQNCLIKK